MEAPSKAFLLFSLLPDWLKLNDLKSGMECGFSDTFSHHTCFTVAETIGVTNYAASFGAKKCSKNHIWNCWDDARSLEPTIHFGLKLLSNFTTGSTFSKSQPKTAHQGYFLGKLAKILHCRVQKARQQPKFYWNLTPKQDECFQVLAAGPRHNDMPHPPGNKMDHCPFTISSLAKHHSILRQIFNSCSIAFSVRGWSDDDKVLVKW